MARRTRAARQVTGLFHARQARGMSRSELVRLSGVSKQQLSRLENGLIRLRLDHLKPFAGPLGYTPEQILLWGRYPGTGGVASSHVESSDVLREDAAHEELGLAPGQVPELDTRAGLGGGGLPAREVRKEGRHADPLKAEGWLFPASFVREQLHTSAARLSRVIKAGHLPCRSGPPCHAGLSPIRFCPPSFQIGDLTVAKHATMYPKR